MHQMKIQIPGTISDQSFSSDWQQMEVKGNPSKVLLPDSRVQLGKASFIIEWKEHHVCERSSCFDEMYNTFQLGNKMRKRYINSGFCIKFSQVAKQLKQKIS